MDSSRGDASLVGKNKLVNTFRCDALVDDPQERARERLYGWDQDELWIELDCFICWECKESNRYYGELARISKSRGAIRCLFCHAWNMLFDPVKFKAQEDLKMLERTISQIDF